MKTVVKMVFGSHLYGTNTPESDKDYKGVYIPNREDYLLLRVPKSIRYNSTTDNIKNNKNDIDDEMYSINHFFKLASEGQTVALDMLFAPQSFWIESSSVWERIVYNREKFLSKNLSAFIGYAKKQAGKYGIKGSRLSALKETIDCLSHCTQSATLSDVWNCLSEGEYQKKYGPDKTGWMIYEVCGRKFQSTAKVGYVYDVLKKVYDNYGERAKQAQRNEGIDWKAMSHAMRAAYEVEELLKYGIITFPLVQADFLVRIKKGEIKFQQVENLLELKIEEIEKLQETSDLPEEPYYEFIEWLLEDILYREIILF
jgi:predicted nucleotidyltransferase